ncbi:imelysin family protein [Chelativorans sp. M5D2P16]|uniref:imelysin family protein n=1 Tax=Chelativorans sp. M5D2P16 TaxID=3095678 RepID=UPI002ACA73D3|nr:imelysin family protein [Chelativorans sp. M5D2P16]MDZ5699800.1 imelysin family protein [Chelativorans sp. M5D2P16]
MLKTLLLCLSLALSLPVQAQESGHIPPDIGTRVADRYAASSLAGFAGVTGRLRGKIEELCARPGKAALAEVRATFADTIRAWAYVSILRFGPLVEENRFEHIFFWPDPRGVTLRQVQGVLAEKDEQAANPLTLKEKSVALQGLPALEFVLFGSGSEALARVGDGFRCRYGTAIAANLANRAAALEAAWAPGSSFHAAFTEPGADNALYRSPKEVAGEVVKALGTTLQFARDAELLPALGDDAAKANGRRAPFWRSNLTFALVGAQIEGTMALLQSTGFGTRLDAERRAVIDTVLFDLEHALGAVDDVQAPAETAFAEEKSRRRITYAAVALKGANRSISEELSAAIGLTMGFNALDGD